MIDEAKYKSLKRRADEARQTRDKAAGQLEATMDRLQNEFGCDSVEAAQRKANQLNKEAAAAEKTYNKAVAAFEEAWGEYTAE